MKQSVPPRLAPYLQLAKQLFSVRLLLMTKFFVMRECDNILSGYLCAVTTVFSQQDGIYGFKFPKRFLEISSRDLTLFSTLLSILIYTRFPTHWYLFPFHSQGSMPCKQQSDIVTTPSTNATSARASTKSRAEG